MIWQNINWVRHPELLDLVQDNDKIIMGNMLQTTEDVDILPGRKDLKIVRVNTINCVFDSSCELTDCNTAINEYEDVEENGEIFKKYKNNKGKRNFNKVSKIELAEILADDEIENEEVFKKYYRKIRKARLAKNKSPIPPKILNRIRKIADKRGLTISQVLKKVFANV